MELVQGFSVIRSKRKSIAIYIKNSTAIIKAPQKTSLQTIKKFVTAKKAWIERKLSENRLRTEQVADILAMESFMCFGHRLIVEKYAKKSVSVCENVIKIPCEYFSGEKPSKSEQLIVALKKGYRRAGKKYLLNRINEISESIGLKFTDFSLTNAKTKWGSCDSFNKIRLNWHLMLLPKQLIDYVIIHELVHTIEHNHSAKFWNNVSLLFPRYKEAIACLKDNAMLISLYE